MSKNLYAKLTKEELTTVSKTSRTAKEAHIITSIAVEGSRCSFTTASNTVYSLDTSWFTEDGKPFRNLSNLSLENCGRTVVFGKTRQESYKVIIIGALAMDHAKKSLLLSSHRVPKDRT